MSKQSDDSAITKPEDIFNPEQQSSEYQQPKPARRTKNFSAAAIAAFGGCVLMVCAICFFAGLQVGKSSSTTTNGFGRNGSMSNGQMGGPPDMNGGSGYGNMRRMMPPNGQSQNTQDSTSDLPDTQTN